MSIEQITDTINEFICYYNNDRIQLNLKTYLLAIMRDKFSNHCPLIWDTFKIELQLFYYFLSALFFFTVRDLIRLALFL